MRLRYKLGLAWTLGATAYVVIYGATLGGNALILFVLAVVGLASGTAGMLLTSWLFDRFVSNRIRAARAPLGLVFFDPNERTARALRQAFQGHPQFTASLAKPGQLTTRQRRLDALCVPLTDAVERWGARPASHKAQVLRTRPEDSGMPPYVVAGVAIGPNDPRAGDPGHELRLMMTAVLDAAKAFNTENSPPIRVVGFWTDMLGMNRINPTEAGKIIISAYEGRLGENSAAQKAIT